MSLFQCQNCGCKENTALACQGCDGYAEGFFDWTGFEDRRGKKLCSACAPTYYSDGTLSGLGAWHGEFSECSCRWVSTGQIARAIWSLSKAPLQP